MKKYNPPPYKAKPLYQWDDPVYTNAFALFAGVPLPFAYDFIERKLSHRNLRRSEEIDDEGLSLAQFLWNDNAPGLGVFWFHERNPIPELIAHESVHAAVALVVHLRGLPAPSLGNDECFAYYIGFLVREINHGLQKRVK